MSPIEYILISPIPPKSKKTLFDPLLPTQDDYKKVLASCQKLERKTFPKIECTDLLSSESQKPNRYTISAIGKNNLTDQGKSKQLIVMGYIHFQVTSINGGSIINTICVHPDYRKQGIASQLMDITINKCLRGKCLPNTGKAIVAPSNVKYCELHVDPERVDAVALYKKFGFKTKVVLTGYYQPNRHAWLMRLDIS